MKDCRYVEIVAEKETVWWKVVFTQSQLHKSIEMVFINSSELSWSELYEVQEVTRSEIPSLFSFLVEVLWWKKLIYTRLSHLTL